MEPSWSDVDFSFEDEVHGKRPGRSRNGSKKNNKRLRAEGKPYIGTSGHAVPARTTGTTCR